MASQAGKDLVAEILVMTHFAYGGAVPTVLEVLGVVYCHQLI